DRCQNRRHRRLLACPRPPCALAAPEPHYTPIESGSPSPGSPGSGGGVEVWKNGGTEVWKSGRSEWSDPSILPSFHPSTLPSAATHPESTQEPAAFRVDRSSMALER